MVRVASICEDAGSVSPGAVARGFVLRRAGRWILVLLAGLGWVGPCAAQSVETWHRRADEAIESFLLKFWSGGRQYLRATYPDTGGLTGYWTYANAWQAVMDAIERTGGRHYAGMIESLYRGQDRRGWYSDWYDDECWMVMALVRAYDLAGDPAYLAQAEAIYTDVQGGWDAAAGGVWWDRAHTQKATAANAGAALAGALLYPRTRKAAYRDFARQVYDFWLANMVDPRTHQVCDHVLPDGTKVWWRFTYNEGLMIGAGLELHRATRDRAYLAAAHQIAGFLITGGVTPTVYGNVLYDGPNDGCGGDCHQFKGPAYRYLTALYRRDTSRTAYAEVLSASANAVWELARDPALTLFAVNWAGPPQAEVDLGQDNSACTALSLYAQLAGPYPGLDDPPGPYEAEDAVLDGVSLEARYGDFTGWGYVAAWHEDGEAIHFRVDCAVPGPREIGFRYAAGAGRASRRILVNGEELHPDLSFADTGSWSAYQTNRFSCALPAGLSTLSVVYDSARGSRNYLNLDHLAVSDVAHPRITEMAFTPAGEIVLTWTSVNGQTYRVQGAETPAATAWSALTGAVTASGPAASAVAPASPARYYRIVTP